MMKIRIPQFWLFIIPLFFVPRLGVATLGEPGSSIEKDRVAMRGKVKKSQLNTSSYSVQLITNPDINGAWVREFENSDGVVFMVCWEGPKPPDLSQLLGTHYAEFQTALKEQSARPGRRFVSVKTSKLTVFHGGHMRNFHGRAIARELVPSGVNAESLPCQN